MITYDRPLKKFAFINVTNFKFKLRSQEKMASPQAIIILPVNDFATSLSFEKF